MQLQLAYKSKSMMAHKFVQNDGTTIGFHGGTYSGKKFKLKLRMKSNIILNVKSTQSKQKI